ncbi:MAG TPA: VOC family protein [Burkholderiaceae bacterium]|nr:VOC family protein [Burkholderiaceae bacterium]
MPLHALAFSHIGIFVADIERMEAFYSGFLGFTVTDRGHLPGASGPIPLVFLSRDPDEHHQLVLAGGRPAQVDFNVVNQISFRADSLSTLKALHAALPSQPVTDIAPVTHGNAISVYFRDPEGNRIEVFVDTPWYVTQPQRVPIDLTLDDAVLWAWAERHARALPGFEPREQWRARLAARMADG